jgi:hypothetical protein
MFVFTCASGCVCMYVCMYVFVCEREIEIV